MIRSLRWRLQAWYGIVLMVLLGLFGGGVYLLEWQNRVQQTDAELDRTMDIVISQIRRILPPPPPMQFRRGRWQFTEPRNDDSQPANSTAASQTVATAAPQTPPTENTSRPANLTGSATNRGGRSGSSRTAGELPPEFVQMFEGHGESPLYFIIWSREGRVLHKSEAAPDVPFPGMSAQSTQFPIRVLRTQGDRREILRVFWWDMNVLVGRSIHKDVAAQHASGLLLAGAGCVMLGIGLLGGWWVSSSAMKPIRGMAEAAQAISAGNLSKRIAVRETDTELGQLAAVLNETFARLQTTFEQQVRFTADASHELRTPVAVILAETDFTLQRERSGDAYREALTTCRKASRRMKSVIDSLLMLARLDADKPQADRRRPISLDIIARDCAMLLQPLADPKKIVLQTDLVPVVVDGEREPLAQVVTNLVTNAIRYNREGGRVEIRTETDGDLAVLSVKDTGIGIKPEDLPQIFERFFRADKSRTRPEGSTGLGLAICQRIVESFGGTISATSEVQVGTTLTIQFPLSAATPAEASLYDSNYAMPVRVETEVDCANAT